jgi:hypothetical protein
MSGKLKHQRKEENYGIIQQSDVENF